MGDPVGWFDLGAADDEPLQLFYASLFGWSLRAVSETYRYVSTGGGIRGGIGRSGTGESWLAFYVNVDDPQASLDRAVSMGGRVVVPVTEAPDLVTFAMFTDPDGLLIGLTRAGDETQEAHLPSGAPVDWFEILGSDSKRSRTFYGELFGWTFSHGDESYGLVDTGVGGILGGVGASSGGPMWATVYANVDDVERYLSRAEELGGTREYGPNDVDDHTRSGAIRDPAGNVFGLYHHAPH